MPASPIALLRGIHAILRSQEEHHRDLRSNAVLVASGVLAAGVGYVWTLLAGRALPLPEYADFAAAAALIYFANGAVAPLAQTVAYFTLRDGASGRVARTAQRIVAVPALALMVAIIGTSHFLTRVLHLRSDLLPAVLGATAVVVVLLAVRRGHLQGVPRFDTYAVSTLAEALIRLGALAMVAVFAKFSWAALATYPVAAAIALLFLPLPRSAADAPVGPMLRYLGPSFLAMAIYSAFLNTDVVLVKLYFPATAAAVYGAASFLGRAGGMIVLPFYVYAVPRLVAAGDDRAELARRFKQIAVRYAVLATAGIAALAVARRFVVTLLVGSAYRAASDLIVPIAVAVAIGGFNFIVCQLPAARERFGFIPWYAAGYVVEIAAVAAWHRSLFEVVLVVIAAQCVTLILIAPQVAVAFRHGRAGDAATIAPDV